MKPCKLSSYYMDRAGYPQRWDSAKGKVCRISRLMLEKKLGRPIKPRLLACHTCDNTSCVEPSHLYEGTHQQNMDDCIRRGRIAKGSDHGNSKLTDEQITFIRTSPMTGRAVAHHLKISEGAVSMIRSRKRWAHL